MVTDSAPHHSTAPSSASIAWGCAIALLAALGVSWTFVEQCFSQEIVASSVDTQPESAGPSFRSAAEQEQLELLRRLLGVKSPVVAPAVRPTSDPSASDSGVLESAHPSTLPAKAPAVAPKPLSQRAPRQVAPKIVEPPEAVAATSQSIDADQRAQKPVPTVTRFDDELVLSSVDLPSPSTSVRAPELERWGHLLIPAMRWAVRRGVPIEVGEPKLIVMEPPRAQATERYHAQVELGPDRKSLRNYVAGIPFPYVESDDSDAAVKLIFNAEKRILFDDVDGRNFGCRTGSLDAHNGLEVERDYRAGHFRRLYYHGRLVVEPKPLVASGEGIQYREAISPFLEPFDYKGAGVTYTRYAEAGRPDDSWLYYPQSRRVRRLSTAQRSDGLFGLDIDLDSYGGFAGNPEWFDWELLGKKTLLSPMHARHEPMQWAPKPGDFMFADTWEPRETWVLAARSRVPGYNFSLRVIYIDAQSMLIPYTEVYDKGGQLWRAYVQQWKAGVDRSMPYTPQPSFRWPTAIVAGLTVFDMQQEHATLCEIPAADAPREEAWHLYEGEDGGSVPEDFDLAGFIEAGR